MDKPNWLHNLIAEGYLPYIATSKDASQSLNLNPFGHAANLYLMENEKHIPFHEAYLLSNSLGFQSPSMKMPRWVYIDCVLMKTAVVGFLQRKDLLPPSVLKYYQDDPSIDLEALDYIPVSGQISSPISGGRILSGFSLFSLASSIDGPKYLGLCTKALALEVYRAHSYDLIAGIAQYNNRAIRIHGRFSPKMEIAQAVVPLHPQKDMTFAYQMPANFDPLKLLEPQLPIEPHFWLRASDYERKKELQNNIEQGRRYFIVPPFFVEEDGEHKIPIIENV